MRERSRSGVSLALALLLLADCSSSSAVRLPAPAGEPAGLRRSPVRARNSIAEESSTERYERRYDSAFRSSRTDPVSTFGIDVDTASYANVRRFLQGGTLPPPDAVRIEELVNYFGYAMPEPEGEHRVGAMAEVGPCPWNAEHRLVRVGLRARSLAARAIPPRSLTFLIDVSGSMNEPRKLPLLRRSLELLVEQLRPQDRVSIAVYAGSQGLVLPPTSGANPGAIHAALERLQAGGSTNGGAGIALAYRVAEEAFIEGGVNRVLLATDGDFNVGVTSPGELVRIIEEKRESGIALTVLGFGMGNLQDSTLESLADRGNGNYAYIDSFAEARKVLAEEVVGTLVTMAQDVKVQIEFNPLEVESYRLLGYENRLLTREQFEDERADAGEMGAGQTVTALYEVVPLGAADRPREPAPLRYQQGAGLREPARSGELMWIQVRYKSPDGEDPRSFSLAVRDDRRALANTSPDFRFASAVAALGLVLRGSEYAGSATPALAHRLAAEALQEGGRDEHREELLSLVDAADRLWVPGSRAGERSDR